MSKAFQNTGHAFQFTGFAFQQEAGVSVGAGRKKKRRLEVEIDGQLFPVESLEHAQALLEQAKELALKQAPIVAEQVVKARLADKAPEGKPIRVPVPRIATPDPELANAVIQARHDIARLYREQALLQELMLRLRLQEIEEDDDEIMLFL